jgi:hypothetical protein
MLTGSYCLQVEQLIAEARAEWETLEHGPEDEMMLPLIRLKVCLAWIAVHTR